MVLMSVWTGMCTTSDVSVQSKSLRTEIPFWREQLSSLHLAGCLRRKASSCFRDTVCPDWGTCQKAITELQCRWYTFLQSLNMPLPVCPGTVVYLHWPKTWELSDPLAYTANPSIAPLGWLRKDCYIMPWLGFLPLDFLTSSCRDPAD